jgi:hypothetical protein
MIIIHNIYRYLKYLLDKVYFCQIKYNFDLYYEETNFDYIDFEEY